jgi:hypothetical protein
MKCVKFIRGTIVMMFALLAAICVVAAVTSYATRPPWMPHWTWFAIWLVFAAAFLLLGIFEYRAYRRA